MPKNLWWRLILTTAPSLAALAQPAGCNTPLASPSVTIALPSQPFAVAPSADGCWVFVSLMGRTPGIAVLRRNGRHMEISRMIALKPPPTGIALTHDGKLLIAAAGDEIVFLDVQRMLKGDREPVLGSLNNGKNSQNVYANVTSDDKLLFVSQERAHSIAVIDLALARANGYQSGAILGKIPVGNAPIALTFSADGKWLYTTSQVALADWNWPKACKRERADPAQSEMVNPQGAVVIVDVARARENPAQSVVARVPAGCSPVRMAISPGGEQIYVTARNSNTVLAFDTAKLLSDSEHAGVGMAPVGAAPVPIAVIDGGGKVVVGNSGRFGASKSSQTLTVLDAAKIRAGVDATLGTVAAGVFPREMRVSADGRTLFLTNFGSDSLQVIDLDRLPLTP